MTTTPQEALRTQLDALIHAASLAGGARAGGKQSEYLRAINGIKQSIVDWLPTALSQQAAQEPQPVAIHQWRKRLTGAPWQDAPYDVAYARIDEHYEARTLYAAAPAALAPDGAAWTRHGSGDAEWWSYGHWQAKKSGGLWKLAHQGHFVCQHEYLQEVMRAACAKPAEQEKACCLCAGAGKFEHGEKCWVCDGSGAEGQAPSLTMSMFANRADYDTAVAQQAPSTAAQGWQRITAPGQVKPGDELRFELCGETKTHTVCMVLLPGTDREEIIYHKRNNWYVITSMAIAGTGSQKNVEFLAHKGAQGDKA